MTLGETRSRAVDPARQLMCSTVCRFARKTGNRVCSQLERERSLRERGTESRIDFVRESGDVMSILDLALVAFDLGVLEGNFLISDRTNKLDFRSAFVFLTLWYLDYSDRRSVASQTVGNEERGCETNPLIPILSHRLKPGSLQRRNHLEKVN